MTSKRWRPKPGCECNTLGAFEAAAEAKLDDGATRDEMDDIIADITAANLVDFQCKCGKGKLAKVTHFSVVLETDGLAATPCDEQSHPMYTFSSLNFIATAELPRAAARWA